MSGVTLDGTLEEKKEKKKRRRGKLCKLECSMDIRNRENLN